MGCCVWVEGVRCGAVLQHAQVRLVSMVEFHYMKKWYGGRKDSTSYSR